MQGNKVVLIIFAFFLVSGFSYYLGLNDGKENVNNAMNKDLVLPIPGQEGCTLETKICPDGTAVERSGPNCDFQECPKASNSYQKQIAPSIQQQNPVKPQNTSTRAISHTNYNNKILIKFDDVIYEEGTSIEDPKILSGVPTDLVWEKLIDIPTEKNDFSELFSYKVLPNKKDFILIARYDYDNIHIYKFTEGTSKFEEILKITKNLTKLGYTFPKLSDIDESGNYAAFNLFGCWNCGGHTPATLLLNVKSGETKDLGKISYFDWKTDGKYEYKEFIEKECDEPGPGVCNEDPKKLPMKSGEF